MQAENLSDDEFLAAFSECRLPAAAFDHRGHVRIAWLLLRRRPLEQAIEEICSGIARMAAHLGAPDKYHRTLSETLIRSMARDALDTTTWEEFLAVNAELLKDVGSLLARHYSPERLSSHDARVRFVSPDRLPLPSCHR